MTTIEKGGQVPDFDAVDIDGRRVAYGDVWQRHALVLVAVDDAVDRARVEAIAARAADLRAHNAVLVITATTIAGLPRPGVLVADQWGEIQFVGRGVPSADDVLAWVEYVEQRCPECEGEAR